jgi:hypothetical protein
MPINIIYPSLVHGKEGQNRKASFPATGTAELRAKIGKNLAKSNWSPYPAGATSKT